MEHVLSPLTPVTKYQVVTTAIQTHHPNYVKLAIQGFPIYPHLLFNCPVGHSISLDHSLSCSSPMKRIRHTAFISISVTAKNVGGTLCRFRRREK